MVSRRPANAGRSSTLASSSPVEALPGLPVQQEAPSRRVLKAAGFALFSALIVVIWEVLPLLASHLLASHLAKLSSRWSPVGTVLLAVLAAALAFLVSYLGFASKRPPRSRPDGA